MDTSIISAVPDDPVGAKLDAEISSLQSQGKHPLPRFRISLNKIYSRVFESSTKAPGNSYTLLTHYANHLVPITRFKDVLTTPPNVKSPPNYTPY